MDNNIDKLTNEKYVTTLKMLQLNNDYDNFIYK